MNFFNRKNSPSASTSVNFDMLRAGLEVEIVRPAVVAITSSTQADGAELAARGLAQSLAAAGYPTLFVDTLPTNRPRAKSPIGVTLEEIGRHVDPLAAVGHFSALNLCDAALQKTTSQRDIQTVLQAFRSKFDYVVVAIEPGASTSFASAFIASADAVMVTIKTGRREKAGDAILAESLKRLGPRFLGVVAMNPAVMIADPTDLGYANRAKDARSGQAASIDHEFAPREVAEWPT